MDKITQQHAKAWAILEPCSDSARRHASITAETAQGFATWKDDNGWIRHDGEYVKNNRKPGEYRNKWVQVTISELYQMYLEHLNQQK